MPDSTPRKYCAVFWGSHGCDVPPSQHTNEPNHICTSWDETFERMIPCSMISPEGDVRYWNEETSVWGEPTPHRYIFGDDWKPAQNLCTHGK